MSERTALVLGGYGSFGRLVAESLARQPQIRVVVAGRDPRAAAALCGVLGARASPAQIDLDAPGLGRRIAALDPSVVINTAGPFQSRDYRVPRACIAAGAHYLDLADARQYVCDIHSLDAAAVRQEVLVASGASTCPALSTAIVDEIARELTIERISFGVAPGHRQARGLATTRAVLSYCGKPIPTLREGEAGHAAGWSGLTRHTFPRPVGARWLSRVDLPELGLWPSRYPALQSLESRAGLEPAALHLGLTALSWLVRARLLESLAPHAESLLRMSARFEPFGTPVGAMHITVAGRDRAGAMREKTWSIVAQRSDGPRIPVAPAVALAKRLLDLPGYAPLAARGAMACMGLLSSAEILAELAGYSIHTQSEEKALALTLP